MNNLPIAFIGGGNMAGSLIGGLVAQGFDPQKIWVSDPVEASRERLSRQFGVNASDNNHAACQHADIVVLAVKPQIMKEVASSLAAALKHRPVVISIAAGIPVKALQQWLGEDIPIIRCMPNTPALVHQGASGLYPTPKVNTHQREQAQTLFAAVGSVTWVENEAAIDSVTALSGSGPAYFFLLMEAMEKAGQSMGLDQTSARQLTLQTALGAATMAMESDVDTAELRRRVTSPGGTTAAAIETFIEGGFEALAQNAIEAAKKRAEQMAHEFSQ